MRSVLYTLQKLKDQETKSKQLQLASAQYELFAQEQIRDDLMKTLEKERQIFPNTAGALDIHERIIFNRTFEVLVAEAKVSEKEDHVEICKEELLFARQEAKVTEELILSMEEKLALENKRKQDKVTDEIGVMAWWRNFGNEN